MENQLRTYYISNYYKRVVPLIVNLSPQLQKAQRLGVVGGLFFVNFSLNIINNFCKFIVTYSRNPKQKIIYVY